VALGIVGTAIIVGGIWAINEAITSDSNSDKNKGGGGGNDGSPSSP
jgi:hypothetical protein